MKKVLALLVLSVIGSGLLGCDILVKIFKPVTKVIVTTPNVDAGLFAVTPGKYEKNSDWDAIVHSEFGTDYRVADWNDLLRFSDNIDNWILKSGVKENQGYWITREGRRDTGFFQNPVDLYYAWIGELRRPESKRL